MLKLKPDHAEILRLVELGYTKQSISETLGVGRSTVYRVVANHKKNNK